VSRLSFALAPLLILLVTSPVDALDPRREITQYRYDHWGTRDGLPQGSVEALVQTSDGYLWLGTQEGLARWNGERFTVFDRTNTPALRHNRVVALHEDRAGTLWIGTEGGGLTRRAGRSFSTFTTDQGLPNDRVREIVEDPAGRLWVGTDEGLVPWEDDHPAGPVVLEGERIQSLVAGDALWVGTSSGLFRLAETGEPEAVELPGEGPVRALWRDEDGSLWAGRTRELVLLSGNGARVVDPGDDPPHPVESIRRDRDGALWVARLGGGLTRLRDDRRETFTTRTGLANDIVLRLYEDREGNLWVGMQDGGLVRLSDTRFATWTAREGLAGDIVWPVLEDREGSVWVGTSASGLSQMRGRELRTYTKKEGLPSNAVQALAEGAAGTLWIGTRGGLARLRDGRLARFTTRDGLPGDSVSALLVARDGTLWVGTRGSGLAHLLAGRFRVYRLADGLPNETIHFIHEDREGSIWIATSGGGLVRFGSGRFRAYTTREGLSADVVNTIHEEADGTLWIGTYGGGLNRLRDGRFTAYTTSEGLFDDAVFQVLDDGRGYFWISCNKGIFRVAREQFDELDRKERARLEPEVYGVDDGMRNRECNGANQPAGWRAADGRLFFPTVEGLVEIDPDSLSGNPLPPLVAIEAVVANGTRLDPTSGLDLEPDTDSLELHYTGLGLTAPERVRFRYQLEGFDRGWVEAGTRRVAYYTQVPPGHYRFRVVAANEDGVWSETPRDLSLTLRPRFYRTGWFTSVLVLGVLGLIGSGYRLRTRHLRRREEELMHLVEQRTKELAEANRRLERLSSLDSVTGVANRRRFDAALDHEWRRGCRSGSPLSVLLLDIDAFKRYNDTYGHLRGDECLQQVAAAISGCLSRAGDLAARYGGEEFVALLPHMGVEDASRVAGKIRAAVEALALPHEGSTTAPVVTISVGGAAVVPRDDGDPSALVAAADEALYAAKRRGRNRVVMADTTS